MGFDNAPVSQFSEPSLTTVNQEYDRVAEFLAVSPRVGRKNAFVCL